ncbi:MAG: FAD binding domain-containing protein [Actinomycetota bacterium]|nr:FAD binding domain-containing protein [Actinomycetota bacterium]MDQ2958710.1 FAD binding domain-containing protein [Actinomycetota bacterium]
MDVLQPTDWDEALRLRAARPDAVPIAGGTDVMVAMKLAGFRPAALLDLSRISGLAGCRQSSTAVELGAATSYTSIHEQHGERLPGLALVARGVGSRQVRNRGTIGGCLAVARPAGDLHPMLLALAAEIELCSVRGSRWLPVSRFYLGNGRTALAADELIGRIRLPAAAGPQRFVRIGRRQAMVKSMCSVAIVLDIANSTLRVGIGAFGGTPCRATAAEAFLAERMHWPAAAPLDAEWVDEFGSLVAGAAATETDLLASADYRSHALAVLARRLLREAQQECQ